MTRAAPGIEVRPAVAAADRLTAFMLRLEVFHAEQGIPVAEEFDADDAEALHMLAECDGQPAGTGRLICRDGVGRIGRMAVRHAFRGRGVGRALLDALVAAAREQGARRIEIHAQTRAAGFYAQAGFTVAGAEFLEVGIPHRRMVLDLAPGTCSGTRRGEGGSSPA